jgi:quercetin dioxygenase-like cupin family protein
MEALNKPNIALLQKSVSYKVLGVTGTKGMLMPDHCSTQEAIITVQKGDAVLTIGESIHQLGQGDFYIIPAGQIHSLLLKSEFKGTVIMLLTSNMEFKSE